MLCATGLGVGAEQPLGEAGSGLSMYVSYPDGGAGKLTVDPDGVEVFINHMERALDKLRDIEREGQWLMDVEPPGDDPFSPIAVADIKRAAGEEPGGHLYANRRAQQAFQAIIDNARASLAAYRENEAWSTERFRGGT